GKSPGFDLERSGDLLVLYCVFQNKFSHIWVVSGFFHLFPPSLSLSLSPSPSLSLPLSPFLNLKPLIILSHLSVSSLTNRNLSYDFHSRSRYRKIGSID